MTAWRKYLVVFVGAAVAAAIAVGSVSADSPEPTPGHVHVLKIFKGQRAGRPSKVANMTYHGGPVETTPQIYIVFWGSWWNTTTTTGSDGGHSFTNTDAKAYINGFLGNVGGSTWGGTVTQYCQGVTAGSASCGTGGQHIANPSPQLKDPGGYVDTATAVPSSPSQSDIAAEAQRMAGHFNLTGANLSQPGVTIFVLTPSHQSMSGFATSWCAWHSVTTFGGSALPYAYVPYQPDAGSACGENFVNSNGYFDGFSIVGGHEYAEAETDPVTSSGSYAWYDQQGEEIGDKCAWSSASGDVTLGGSSYAVQPLWSNAISSCATPVS